MLIALPRFEETHVALVCRVELGHSRSYNKQHSRPRHQQASVNESFDSMSHGTQSIYATLLLSGVSSIFFSFLFFFHL